MIKKLPERTQDEKFISLENQAKPFPMVNCDTTPHYFLERNILVGFLNAEKEEIVEDFSGKESVSVITGFGLTGLPHLGTKIIRDELSFFLNVASHNEIFICVSIADAYARNQDKAQVKKSLNAFKTFFSVLLSKENCFLVHGEEADDLVEKSLWDESLATKAFETVFGLDYNSKKGTALAYMAKTIFEIARRTGKRSVVLLGIDEIKNALFVTKAAESMNLQVPIFLFNRIVPGYNSPKMGKSIPQSSCIFGLPFSEEYAKAKQHFGEISHDLGGKCALCDIIFFSGYPINISDKNILAYVHKNAEKILKKIYFQDFLS